METHLLRTFVTVARLGSFSAAAEELGYTQSAVSQQIAALEHDLGVVLLARRPVAPTAAGERLLEHAGPLLLRVQAARADVTRAIRPHGPVRLALTPLALPQLTPQPAATQPAAFQAATQPAAFQFVVPRGVAISVHVTDAEHAARLVASAEADLALVDGIAAPTDPLPAPATAPLHAQGVAEHPLVIALPAAHPLAGRPALDLADLVDALWIDAPQICGPLSRLRAASGLDGFRTGLHYTGCDTRTLLTLIAAGHGLAILPAGAAQHPHAVQGVPLAGPRLVHRVELLHGGHLPPGPAATLAEHLASALA
ncbi:LysR family transcriptional regulator [Nonomuraea soli]|uniref:DNA-binding transcriptional LysR family regulator n=1 Tax=Nonomuraea soli TaxID=1032476 RepID=A0A7W0HPW7_9ACTN|nr:LysR family transcriptional regulator [Nonomuraea soli]MBA2891187.1 DNA-binding transcriptional LysR family regulator [Nonomuraea soli]